jgi:hypothetical protein
MALCIEMDVSSVGKLERVSEFAGGPARYPVISYRSIEPIAIVVDTLIVFAACAIWNVLCVGTGAQAALLTLGTAPVVCALFVFAAKLASAYRPSALLAEHLPIYSIASLWFGTMALLGIGLFTLQAHIEFPLKAGVAFALVGLLGLLAHRVCWRMLVGRAAVNGGAPARRAVLIHQSGSSPYVGATADLRKYGLCIEQRLNIGSVGGDEALVRQAMEEAVVAAKKLNADEILVDVDIRDWQRLKPHLACLRQLPIPVSLIAHDWLAEFVRQPAHILGSSTLVEVQHSPLNLPDQFIKRTMDLAVSVIALVLLCPLLIAVALMIFID